MAMKFVAREKMSEKQKRKIVQNKRVTWTMNPVTRVEPSGKEYDRIKFKAAKYGE